MSSYPPIASSSPVKRKSLLKLGLVAECSLYRRPTVWLAVLALIFVPSLYVIIYVSSVWDPYGNLRQLPAALVNEDAGFTIDRRAINLGAEVEKSLAQKPAFAFQSYPDAETARGAVREGKVFFALILPADLTRRAVSTGLGTRANFEIFLSEGGNYTASLLSKRFGLELAHTLNEKINQQRWASLIAPHGTKDQPSLLEGLTSLRTGAHRLSDGAVALHTGGLELLAGLDRAAVGVGKLDTGAGKLAEGASQLTGGVERVKDALATIAGQLPTDGQMAELSAGSGKLVEGSSALREGLDRLQAGSLRLEDGAQQLQQGASRVPVFGSKLSAGAGQLKAGMVTYGAGVATASTGSVELNEGMKRLDTGVKPLSAGVIRLNAGLATLRAALPDSERLNLFSDSMLELKNGTDRLSVGLAQIQEGGARFDRGSAAVAEGAQQLADGLDRADSAFATAFSGADTDQLAAPVEVRTEIFAAVPNNGTAFAPYFGALSLWIGAVMMSFVFYFRRLIDPLKEASRLTKWFIKASPLYVIGALQATVVYGVLAFVLKIHLAAPMLMWAMTLLGSFAFVSLIVCFLLVLGDAGRLLAIVLLIFQLAASGGIYPVELSPAFYQQAHPHLPFTLLVRTFRATMFSAFNTQWQSAAGELAAIGGIAIILGMIFARWKYYPREEYGPAVDF